MSKESDEIEKSKVVMQSILSEVIEKSESYKFIRMADDLHDVAQYLNDMRLCFIALTATGYLLLVVYLIILCARRNRRQQQPRRRNWDYQMENQRDFSAAQTTEEPQQQTRTEINNTGYMGRNHHRGAHSVAPSFMRHGQMNHQQTTRLMSEPDGAAVKHHIPHITTDPPQEEKSKVPQLVKDSLEN